METNTLPDPARLAQAIRGLARVAHETLTHSPSPAGLRRLSRRINTLTESLGDSRGGQLGAWLDNLGREVRSAPCRGGRVFLAPRVAGRRLTPRLGRRATDASPAVRRSVVGWAVGKVLDPCRKPTSRPFATAKTLIGVRGAAPPTQHSRTSGAPRPHGRAAAT